MPSFFQIQAEARTLEEEIARAEARKLSLLKTIAETEAKSNGIKEFVSNSEDKERVDHGFVKRDFTGRVDEAERVSFMSDHSQRIQFEIDVLEVC
jgi:hypothetical protein